VEEIKKSYKILVRNLTKARDPEAGEKEILKGKLRSTGFEGADWIRVTCNRVHFIDFCDYSNGTSLAINAVVTRPAE
jgi:hypothetical protein